MTDISREEALSHFGVPGMKWGVRKAAGSAGEKIRNPLTPGQKDALKTLAVGGATVATGLLAGPIAATAVSALGRAAQVATRPYREDPNNPPGQTEKVARGTLKTAKVAGYTGVAGVTAVGAYQVHKLMNGPMYPNAIRGGDVKYKDIAPREPFEPSSREGNMRFNPNARVDESQIEDES